MRIKLLPSLLLFSATTLMALPAAMAQDSECSVDADCPMDYTCEEIGAYACASPPPCEEGDTECMAEQEDLAPCESGTIMGCVAPPPEACDPAAGEAACDGGLTCVTYTYEQCSGGDVSVGTCTVTPDGEEVCEESSPQDPVDEPSCITESESYCVPAYFAPCEIDSDCGDGFRCEEEPVRCYSTCMGGGATVDGDEGEPVEPECMEMCEESSGEKYCELIEVSCSSDADCSGDMSCQDVTIYEATPGVPCTTQDPDDGDESAPDCEGGGEEVEVTESYCLPPNWDRWVGGSDVGGGGYVDYDESVSEPTSGGSQAGGGNGEDDSSDWKLVDKQKAPSKPAQDGGSDEADAGGCQTASTGSAPGGAGLGFLAALGMMLGLRRRRKSA